MHIGFHVKYTLFLSDFNENLIFSTDFRKMLRYKIWWKPIQWEKSFAHADKTDRQTEMTKIVFAFQNLAKAPDNEHLYQKKKKTL